jgi:hypothetical protein
MAKTTEITIEKDSNDMEKIHAELDLSTLSVKDLADLLAKARQAEKAAKAAQSTLPMYAYVMVMTDSSLVYWSGRAASATEATQAAMAYATQDGKEIYKDSDGLLGIAARPIPAPRGRKAKVDVAS